MPPHSTRDLPFFDTVKKKALIVDVFDKLSTVWNRSSQRRDLRFGSKKRVLAAVCAAGGDGVFLVIQMTKNPSSSAVWTLWKHGLVPANHKFSPVHRVGDDSGERAR